MNIYSLSTHATSLFKERILPALSSVNKKTIAIAIAAFALLAYICCTRFTVKKIANDEQQIKVGLNNQEKKENANKIDFKPNNLNDEKKKEELPKQEVNPRVDAELPKQEVPPPPTPKDNNHPKLEEKLPKQAVPIPPTPKNDHHTVNEELPKEEPHVPPTPEAKKNSPFETKELLGTYLIQDISHFDRTIIVNGRVFKMKHAISNWQQNDQISIFKDHFSDKGLYALKNMRTKKISYGSPCDLLKLTLEGNCTSLNKTLWRKRIRGIVCSEEGQGHFSVSGVKKVFYHNNFLSLCIPTDWKAGDTLELKKRGEEFYLKNIDKSPSISVRVRI